MPLQSGSGKDVIGQNIKELRKGKTFSKTRRKFGAAKARKQSIAIALSEARKKKGY